MHIETSLQTIKDEMGRGGQKGFSMVEVMVAMVIFLGVTGSIWGLMQTGLRTRNASSESVSLTKTVRLGLNLVGRDTYNAGLGYPDPLDSPVFVPNNRISNLLGIPADPDLTRDPVPPIISGNNITLNTFNQTAGVLTDQVTFLFSDTTFNPVDDPALVGNNPISRPLDIAPRVAGNPFTASGTGCNGQCAVNDLYLATGANRRLGVATNVAGNNVTFANGDPLNLNLNGSVQSMDGGVTTGYKMLRIDMVTYFVTADGTLTRRRYVNVPPAVPVVGWVDEPLVYGVENFQIRYVMNDGAVVDNPGANLALVRQVRYTVSVRSVEPASNGQFQRETMTSTFSTRNLGYDAS